MPSFPFSISVSTTPALEVFGIGISYEEILNSLGNYFYLVEKIFIHAANQSYVQVNQPIQFTKYNINGSENKIVINPKVDPYAKQSALLEDLTGRNVIFDGQTIMAVDFLPSQVVRFTFFTKRNYLSNGLTGGRPKDKMPNV